MFFSYWVLLKIMRNIHMIHVHSKFYIMSNEGPNFYIRKNSMHGMVIIYSLGNESFFHHVLYDYMAHSLEPFQESGPLSRISISWSSPIYQVACIQTCLYFFSTKVLWSIWFSFSEIIDIPLVRESRSLPLPKLKEQSC